MRIRRGDGVRERAAVLGGGPAGWVQVSISTRTAREAELRMWMDALSDPDWRMRLLAGERVCELVGLAEAVRAVAPGGALRPAPSWPACDIAPSRAVVEGAERWLVCAVRTMVQGVPLMEEVRVRVPLEAGALEEAVERGRRELARRMVG